jgi:hypothetical protein
MVKIITMKFYLSRPITVPFSIDAVRWEQRELSFPKYFSSPQIFIDLPRNRYRYKLKNDSHLPKL